MESDALLSGKKLEEKVEQILLNSQTSLPLKKTISSGEACNVSIYRCNRFQALIDYLDDHTQVGTLDTQHNIIKIFLKIEHFGGKAVFTEVPIVGGIRLDLVVQNRAYELKTMKNVKWQKIQPKISKFYTEMQQNQQIKDLWELTFFCKRHLPKSKNSLVCVYYLVVIEITASKTSPKPKEKQKFIQETQKLVNKAVAQVQEEDDIEEEGILFPVKNVLLMDNMREKVKSAELKLGQSEAKLGQTEAKLEQSEAKLEQSEAKLEQSEAEKNQVKTKLEQSEAEKNLMKTKVESLIKEITDLKKELSRKK